MLRFLARFDEFGIGTRAEMIIDNGTTPQPNSNVGDTNNWLLMTRTGGTNFNFYQRMNPTDPWKPTPIAIGFSVTNFADCPCRSASNTEGFRVMFRSA